MRGRSRLLFAGMLLMFLLVPSLALAAGEYEPDNTLAEATLLSTTTPQWRETEGPPTQDWMALDVVAGKGYDIRVEFVGTWPNDDARFYEADGTPLQGVSKDDWWMGFVGSGQRFRYLAECDKRVYIHVVQTTQGYFRRYVTTVLEREPNTFYGTVATSPTASPSGWTVRMVESVNADIMEPGSNVITSCAVAADGSYRLATMLDDIRVTLQFVSPDPSRWPSWFWGEPQIFQPCYFQYLHINGRYALQVDYQPQEYGSVAGHVYDEHGQPFPGASVKLQASWNSYMTTVTAGDGSYAFHQVDPRSSWQLSTADPLGRCLDMAGNHSAPVSPAATTSVDATLSVGGAIVGQVTDELSGLPVQGAEVTLYLYDEPEIYWYFEPVMTDAQGYYSFIGLLPRAYAVRAEHGPQHHGHWSSDNNITDERLRLDVALGTTVTADVRLYPDGTPPVSTHSLRYGLDGQAYVTLTSSDGTSGAGVDTIYYRVGYWGETVPYAGPFVIWPGDYVYFNAVDIKGNWEENKEFAYFGPESTRCSLSVDEISPSWDQTITLSAQIQLASSGSLAAAPVRFEARRDGDWVLIGDVQTDDGGQAHLQTKAQQGRKTLYRAFFSGASDIAAESGQATVTPRVRLSTPRVPAAASVGVTVPISTSLWPRHPAGSRPVVFVVYRATEPKWRLTRRWPFVFTSRTWARCGTVRGTASDISGGSTCAGSFRPSSPGLYRIRALAPADDDHSATGTGQSEMLRVR